MGIMQTFFKPSHSHEKLGNLKHLNKQKPKASINKQIRSFARLHIFF